MHNENNYHALCDELAAKQPVFAEIIAKHGYPLYQTRDASFITLLRLILEQQVSLSSAKACFEKLKTITVAQTGQDICTSSILQLSDEDLRSAGISRQKTVYLRALSVAIESKTLDLEQLHTETDEAVRAQLTAIKGIGNWTADVFLMECLGRTDIFPIGDVALRTAMKKALDLDKETTHETLVAIAESYRPLRSIATFIFWHAYVSDRGINLKSLLS
jgi:DNA-3-methyladenine glycosylase II